MRYFRIQSDFDELGHYVVAEFSEGYVLDDFRCDWSVLSEDEAERFFPEAMAAWRRRDDQVAAQTNEVLRVCWEAEAAATEG